MNRASPCQRGRVALRESTNKKGFHPACRLAFRYDLLDEGRRLRAMEQLRGTDHDQDNVCMFDRR